MTQILAVSKATKNVLTATSPNDFILHSLYNSFKIIAQGTTTYTIGAEQWSEAFKTVAHGQATKPFVFSFILWSDGLISMAGGSKKGSLVGSDQIYNSSYIVDSTYIKWGFQSFSASTESITIAYIICECTVN